jgi:hypothetical protein
MPDPRVGGPDLPPLRIVEAMNRLVEAVYDEYALTHEAGDGGFVGPYDIQLHGRVMTVQVYINPTDGGDSGIEPIIDEDTRKRAQAPRRAGPRRPYPRRRPAEPDA